MSRSKNDPSQSLQMMERPLLTSDELKSMPKGQFVVMKTGAHPMQIKQKLFFQWWIRFEEDNPYTVEDHGGRRVEYASRQEIIDGILKKYHPEWMEEDLPLGNQKGGGLGQAEHLGQAPSPMALEKTAGRKGRAGGMNPIPPSRRQMMEKALIHEPQKSNQLGENGLLQELDQSVMDCQQEEKSLKEVETDGQA